MSFTPAVQLAGPAVLTPSPRSFSPPSHDGSASPYHPARVLGVNRQTQRLPRWILVCRGEHKDEPECKQNLGGQDNEEVRGGSTEAVFVSPGCQRNCP